MEDGYHVLAEAQLGQGQISQATESYHKLEKLSDRGASIAAAGLADLAGYEGRYAEAERIFERGASSDLAAKNPGDAADKLMSWAISGFCAERRGRRK